MSYKSGFFDAVELGDGTYDRVYSAADFAEYFSRFVGNGVFLSSSSNLLVQSSGGMSISIQPGYAWINGYLFSVISGANEVLTIPVANPTMNRYDSVVLGLNYQNRQITPYIKSGTPASNPSPVTLTRNNSVYEIEIARVYVPTGTSYVSQTNITDTRPNKSRCGFVTGLVDQIDTTELFSQFQAAFTAWFEDLQNTLSDDVAGRLLARIQSAERDISDIQQSLDNLSDTTKMSNTKYLGKDATSKSVAFSMSPRRIIVTQATSETKSGKTVYTKDELEIVSADGDTYTGVFTRLASDGTHDVKIIPINKTITEGNTIIGWSSTTPAYACNINGRTYRLTAWGV